jgi:hypothetical protein
LWGSDRGSDPLEGWRGQLDGSLLLVESILGESAAGRSSYCTVNVPGVVLVPPGVVTVIGPDVEPAGTVANR